MIWECESIKYYRDLMIYICGPRFLRYNFQRRNGIFSGRFGRDIFQEPIGSLANLPCVFNCNLLYLKNDQYLNYYYYRINTQVDDDICP